MEIRGHRECVACGNRWSYYETGELACPACGEMRSVSVEDNPKQHTATSTTLDLTDARTDIETRPIEEIARDAETAARRYVNRRGFIDAGELCALDEAFLTACELEHVAATIHRALTIDEAEETYFLSLLQAADAGERPETPIPDSLAPARGLAVAEAVARYRRELVDWLATHDTTLPVRPTLDQLHDHIKRIDALDGDIDPANAERLVTATRELATAISESDETALARAQDRLESLA
ncbi:MAG: TFIIB-type zinc ribbon-containing protein [Halobacteriales archaeon]|nr:TFIIB-type zinc ribbon-containing protein [Halobacteriales archaeon]